MTFCQKVLKGIPHRKLCSKQSFYVGCEFSRIQKLFFFMAPQFWAARMGETTTADPMKAFDGQLETFWADIAGDGDRAWLGLDFSSQVGKTGRYFGSI